MKLASLLAGVAVVALSATAASAQSVRTFQDGQQSRVIPLQTNFGSQIGNVNVAVPIDTVDIPHAGLVLNIPFVGPIVIDPPISNAQNAATANNAGATNAAWHAAGISVGNVGGNGDQEDRATFSLSGTVTEDCAFYTGTSNSLSFDFGQIGIYASDNTGAAAAFTMVAPAALNFDTNLAGCNTASRVTLEKLGASPALGLVNTSAGNYDDNVFQANLPYNITARYTATTGTGPEVGSLQTLTVGNNQPSNFRDHGAWKSNMDIEVVIPQADQALVAGTYSGSFRVTVAAS